MNYVDDLLESNHLRQYERNGYPVLAATMRGRADAEEWLAAHPDYAAYAELDPEAAAADSGEEDGAAGDKYTPLQKALWLWRRRTAEEFGLPPYVIMSNELMLRIAETRPADESGLAALPGMGAQRLQHHGAVILDLIQLNPPAEGDEELLAAQRAELTAAGGRLRKSAKAATVSPQTERKIFLKLQELRQKCAVQERIPAYQIANNGILKQIAAHAPTTQAELEAIVGFRSSGLNSRAEEILAMVVGLVEE
ncbi:MAG: HRDC domain-containing protein [Caldilineaceae bacterium]